MTPVADDLTPLRSRLQGDILAPGDDGWDEARAAWNLLVDRQPALIAIPEAAGDVAEVVRFAGGHGLRVNTQATGHNAIALGPMDDTILLRTERMRGVAIDAGRRTVRVEAGAIWGDVTGPAAERGLAALAGSAPDVGVVGYLLGGGLSILSRAHGLAANGITAIEIVDARGEQVRTDAEHEPDLFWALRGGGGAFGVVTAIEFDLHPITELYQGMLAWPWERSQEVLDRWRSLLPDLPDEMSTAGRMIQIPPMPEIPEPLRGRPFAMVLAAFLGSQGEGEALLAPLRELGPEIDTLAVTSPLGLANLFMDPPMPVPALTEHRHLRSSAAAGDAPDGTVGPDLIDSLVRVAGPDSGSPLLTVDLRQLGGAIGRRPEGAGAVGSFDADLNMMAIGIPMDPAAAPAITATLENVSDATAPFDAGNAYGNFAEQPADPGRFFDQDTLRRLREAKASWDPGGMFRAAHDLD